MSVPTCNHLKEDGVYCGSPALNGRKYCYFHLNLRGRRTAAAHARRLGHNPPLNLPFPEDMHAVQVCLAEVMWAVAEDRIETKRAWAILNSLQQASTNLNRTPNWQGEREAVSERRPLRALNDPNFERRHDLPADIDLDAEQITSCHPVQERAEPSAFESIDPFSNCHPQWSRPSLAAESKDFFPANNPVSPDSIPDRIPLPEDEVRQLGMSEIEKIEFFVHKCKYDSLTPEQEHALLIQFLRQKRKEDAADPAFAQERRQFSEELATARARRQAAQPQEDEAA